MFSGGIERNQWHEKLLMPSARIILKALQFYLKRVPLQVLLMGISNRLRTIAEESVKGNYCLLEVVISHSLMEQQDAPFSKIQRLEQHLQGNPYSPSAKGCSD